MGQVGTRQQGFISSVVSGQDLHLMKGLHRCLTLAQHVLRRRNGQGAGKGERMIHKDENVQGCEFLSRLHQCGGGEHKGVHVKLQP